MVVDNDEAIRRAVRSFYDGASFDEYQKASGKDTKYTKESFDKYEKKLNRANSKQKENVEIETEEEVE